MADYLVGKFLSMAAIISRAVLVFEQSIIKLNNTFDGPFLIYIFLSIHKTKMAKLIHVYLPMLSWKNRRMGLLRPLQVSRCPVRPEKSPDIVVRSAGHLSVTEDKCCLIRANTLLIKSTLVQISRFLFAFRQNLGAVKFV